MTHLRWKYFLAAITVATATAFAPLAQAANRCNMEILTQLMTWCVEAKNDLSDYQKTGRDEIIEGRFCKNSGLVADGYFICQGHDAQAMALGFECWKDQHMKAAVAALAESDSRKPVQCKP